MTKHLTKDHLCAQHDSGKHSAWFLTSKRHCSKNLLSLGKTRGTDIFQVRLLNV